MGELTDILTDISNGNSSRFSIQRQEVLDLNVSGVNGTTKCVVSIYTVSKYAQFHDEFIQTAPIIPELRSLIQYLDQLGYRTNLD